MKRETCLLAILVAAGACSKTPEPPPASTTSTATPISTSTSTATPTATSATTSTTTTVGDIAWDVPSAWKSEPASGMRKATYKIDDAEMSVTQVGGGVDANVERWASQFPESKSSLKRSEKKMGPLKVTVVELRGRFTGGGMPGMAPAEPKSGYALLGAIVEGPDPPYFFKLIGPEKTVDGARADFDKLVASVRPK